MDEHSERLAAELDSAERVLRDALDFINDDRHLTARGRAERAALLAELEEIERDLEAIRQEHSPE